MPAKFTKYVEHIQKLSTQGFTDQKLCSPIFPCRSFVVCPALVTSPLPCVKRANTKNLNTKYTNTANDEMLERPDIYGIFLKQGLFIKDYQFGICPKENKNLIMMSSQREG